MKKIVFSLFAFALIGLSACKNQVKVPTEVATEDMVALFMDTSVDVDKAVAYANAWNVTLKTLIDKKITDNSELSATDLEAESKRAQEVVSKLEAIASLADGEARTNLTSAALKAKSEIERAQRFIETHKAAAKPAAAPAAPTQAAPAPAAPAVERRVVCHDPDGWVNIRQGASANSAILDRLYEDGSTAVVIGRSGNWLKVNYNGTIGYIHKDHCRYIN